MLVNKNYEIFTKKKVLFYFVEGLMAGLIVTFVVVSESIRVYVLVGGIIGSIVGIGVEMVYVYYSGVDLARSGKVHPLEKYDEDDK